MRRPASLSTIRAFSTLAMMVASACVAAQTAIVDAIEFYNASLDHYFVTSIPIEIQKLDVQAVPPLERGVRLEHPELFRSARREQAEVLQSRPVPVSSPQAEGPAPKAPPAPRPRCSET